MKCVTSTILLLAILGGVAKAQDMAPTLQDAISPSVTTDAAFLDTLLEPAVVPASERLDINRAEAVESQSPPENCDCAKQQALSKAAAGAHKVLLFDNNFDYLCDPCLDQSYLGDHFKRNQVGDWGVLDVGGQYRMRHHSERNMRGLGLTGRDDDFLRSFRVCHG